MSWFERLMEDLWFLPWPLVERAAHTPDAAAVIVCFCSPDDETHARCEDRLPMPLPELAPRTWRLN